MPYNKKCTSCTLSAPSGRTSKPACCNAESTSAVVRIPGNPFPTSTSRFVFTCSSFSGLNAFVRHCNAWLWHQVTAQVTKQLCHEVSDRNKCHGQGHKAGTTAISTDHKQQLQTLLCSCCNEGNKWIAHAKQKVSRVGCTIMTSSSGYQQSQKW
jgi:hypothetical protein